jgi:hypothetical protein
MSISPGCTCGCQPISDPVPPERKGGGCHRTVGLRRTVYLIAAVLVLLAGAAGWYTITDEVQASPISSHSRFSSEVVFANGWRLTDAENVGWGNGLAVVRPDGTLAYVFR